MDYAVIAKNLSKSYSGREILKNCSIKVEKGIIYGLWAITEQVKPPCLSFFLD